jgi:hypothetical protein
MEMAKSISLVIYHSQIRVLLAAAVGQGQGLCEGSQLGCVQEGTTITTCLQKQKPTTLTRPPPPTHTHP